MTKYVNILNDDAFKVVTCYNQPFHNLCADSERRAARFRIPA